MFGGVAGGGGAALPGTCGAGYHPLPAVGATPVPESASPSPPGSCTRRCGRAAPCNAAGRQVRARRERERFRPPTRTNPINSTEHRADTHSLADSSGLMSSRHRTSGLVNAFFSYAPKKLSNEHKGLCEQMPSRNNNSKLNSVPRNTKMSINNTKDQV